MSIQTALCNACHHCGLVKMGSEIIPQLGGDSVLICDECAVQMTTPPDNYQEGYDDGYEEGESISSGIIAKSDKRIHRLENIVTKLRARVGKS